MSRVSFRRWFLILAAALWAVALGGSAAQAQPKRKAAEGKVRTYYIAADEVEWNYLPTGMAHTTGPRDAETAKVYTERGPDRIGTVYRKAIFREYTDATFTKVKPRPPEWEHLGLLGPVIHAEVGDTIKAVFKNNATRPYSMHPHGVFYLKPSEGSPYDDGVAPENKKGAAVPPGGTFTYEWPVPERAGPAPADPGSIVWLYHSHVDEPRDVNTGLIGAIVITARGKAKPDGRPADVDREFVTLFMLFDENQSWYLDKNIETYTSDPKKVNKLDFKPINADGTLSGTGTGFAAANFRAAVNGFQYANCPGLVMRKGERVRWYLLALGDALNLHTPHWHGNVVTRHGSRTDLVWIGPATMETLDMVPDNPGVWMFHCHVSEHMEAGMHVHYEVKP